MIGLKNSMKLVLIGGSGLKMFSRVLRPKGLGMELFRMFPPTCLN